MENSGRRCQFTASKSAGFFLSGSFVTMEAAISAPADRMNAILGEE